MATIAHAIAIPAMAPTVNLRNTEMHRSFLHLRDIHCRSRSHTPPLSSAPIHLRLFIHHDVRPQSVSLVHDVLVFAAANTNKVAAIVIVIIRAMMVWVMVVVMILKRPNRVFK